MTRYTGTLAGIGPAWSELHAYLTDQGLTPSGPNREIYLAGSLDEPNSWVVHLQQPVS